MNDGLVSIIMPAYNAEKFIASAIDSVVDQSYPSWELIIVDDGSKDRTAEIAAGYADSRICLIRQPNQGEAAARNTALEHSTGEFIAFLDADDLFLPEHLQATVDFLQAHAEFDAVYTDGYHIDEQGNRLLPLSARRRGPFTGWIFEELVRAPDVIGPPGCIVLRAKPVVEEALRFDPQIGLGTDWDFVTRYAENHPFGYLDRPTYLYRVHQSNITRTTDRAKRAASWARCRMKAIHASKFGQCAPETRYKVFYDLLIDHLSGMTEQQAAIIGWPEFEALPRGMRAKLLRLMASNAILVGGDPTHIKSWLESSLRINRSDWSTLLLHALYNCSPTICQSAISVRRLFSRNKTVANIFETQ